MQIERERKREMRLCDGRVETNVERENKKKEKSEDDHVRFLVVKRIFF